MIWSQFNRIWLVSAVTAGVLFSSGARAAGEAPLQSEASTTEPTLFIRLPENDAVAYRGSVSLDAAGLGSSSFLYPAAGAGGLLVAVFTHGIIVDSAKKGQKERLQTTADQVLKPYLPILEGFTYGDLMRRAVAETSSGEKAIVIEPSGQAGSSTVIESLPVFSMTQDQRAIIVDNLIAIQKPGIAPEAAYRSAIRVVSRDWKPANPVAFWTAEDGERLKAESARLVAESLEIALLDAAQGDENNSQPQRTVRYWEGGVSKFERAQVLKEQCDRLLIRNLRGILMSVPPAKSITAVADSAHCG